MPRLNVRLHAAERYVERIDPSLTVAEASRLLNERAPSARPLGLRTPRGSWLYELPGPPCALLVIKFFPNETRVSTVFSPDDPPSARNPLLHRA